MPEVATVNVDFEKKTATVVTKVGQTLSRERVAQTLKEHSQNRYGVVDFTEQPAPRS